VNWEMHLEAVIERVWRCTESVDLGMMQYSVLTHDYGMER
jgi:hypothetical protein